MRKYIIVSHKRFAEGLKSTLDFFTRMGDQITAISAYEHGKNNFPEEELRQVIAETDEGGQVIIMTDLLGGSVNQHANGYAGKDVFVVTGVNLALAMALVLSPEEQLTAEDIERSIETARSQMVLMNTYQPEHDGTDE